MPLPPNVLWIAEQIPGFIYQADVTNYLRVGFWESFNIPFSEYIFNVSGFPSQVDLYGNWYTYSMCPRATIFRRQAGGVETLEDMQIFMRYNDWESDPLSLGNPGNQISSRFDLVVDNNSTNPALSRAAFGGVDSKITSSSMVRMGMAIAQCGPTHDQQPVFDWTATDFDVVHLGQPNSFDFGWIGVNNTMLA